MKKVIKLTESDLENIVLRVLKEQIEPPKEVEIEDSRITRVGGTKLEDGRVIFACLQKIKNLKLPESTGKYNVLGSIYSFYSSGNYTREAEGQSKSSGTWRCDEQGFIEMDGKRWGGDPEEVPTDQPKKEPFQWKQAPTAEEVQNGTKLLRYGMMGDFVKVVQEKLQSEGYNVGPIDSKFGGKTLKAVKEFQVKVGLKDDGLVGKNTYFAMFRETQTPITNLKTKGIKDVNSTKTTTTNQEQPFTSGMTTIDQDGNRTVVTKTTSNAQTQPAQTQTSTPAQPTQPTPPQTSNIETQEW